MTSPLYPEGLEKKDVTDPSESTVQSLTDLEIRSFFNTMFRTADESRNQLKVLWNISWDMYNGLFDWSQKDWWQSRSIIPKVRQAVDRAAGIFRSALVRMKRFYSIESETKSGEVKGSFTMGLMDFWLDRTKWLNEFNTALKAGLITGQIILKVWWKWEEIEEPGIEIVQRTVPIFDEEGVQIGTQQVERAQTTTKKRVKGGIAVKAVDPFNFWVVPDTQGTAVIERTQALLADLEALPRIYDSAAVSRLRAKVKVRQDELDRRRLEDDARPVVPNEFLKPIELFHFWGNIYGPDGDIRMRNARFTMAEDEVIRKPETNPFFHKKPPYVFGTPYVVPFSIYNRGLVQDVVGLASMITELSNLLIDGAMFDAARVFEVDTDLLYDAKEASTGVYPGKVFRKQGLKDPTGNRRVAEPVEVGQAPREALSILGFMNGEFQEGSNITEFISGTQRRGGNPATATEVQTKTLAAQTGLNDAARTVEETVINPLLDMMAKVIYQFQDDFSLPRLIEDFPEIVSVLQDMEPEDRYVLMAKGFDFRARGVSLMLDKSAQLGNVIEFLNAVVNIPGAQNRVNFDYLIEEVAQGFAWDSTKVLQNPAQAGGVTPAIPSPPTVDVTPVEQAPTPAQVARGEQGRRLGGARNNPAAI